MNNGHIGVSRRITVIGVTIATLLMLAPAARGDGLTYEEILTSRWRDLFYRHSPLGNPALLTEEDYKTARFVFSPTMMEFSLLETGFTLPIGLYQSAGFTWTLLGSGSFPQMEGGEQKGEISQQNHFFSASYAINPWRRLSVGGNVNMAVQNLFDETRIGIPPGLDLGATYRFLQHPLLGYHIAGMTLQNALAPSLGDKDIFSRNLRLSWLSYFWESRIEHGLDVNVRDVLAQSEMFKETSQSDGLVDAAKQVEWEANYRLGGWIMRIAKLYWLMGFGENDFSYWGFALGVNLPSLNSGRDIEFLYQFNTLSPEDKLYSNSLYLRAELGRHREEIFARKMAQQLAASPNKLYIEAMKLYHDEQYWDALFVFGELASRFPDFFKNDWVHYYMRSCQEHMDMRDEAKSGYQEVIKEYPESKVVDYANLGIMRVAYKQDMPDQVIEQFAELDKKDVPDSLKYHAYYLMGETYLQQGEVRKAVQVLDAIPQAHPEFMYAQHSLGVCQILLDNREAAQSAFARVIDMETKTEAHIELKNRTYVMLGFLFYENAELPKAITALRQVDVSSYYYEDALLGKAWVALKAKNWNDCVQAVHKLQATTDKDVLKAEALLVKAYVHLLKQEYPEAKQILTDAQKIATGLSEPPEDSLNVRKDQYKKTRTVYDSVAEQAYIISTERKTSEIYRMIDSLRQKQIAVKEDIEEFQDFADRFDRRMFFSHNISRVKNDIEYALAHAENMISEKEERKIKEKAQEQEQKLEEEIERIQRQLEEEDGQGDTGDAPEEEPDGSGESDEE